jgi:glycosyltransferase 2 family protein
MTTGSAAIALWRTGRGPLDEPAARTGSRLSVLAGSRSVRRWGPVLVGVALLVVLVLRLGSGPFVDGLRLVDAPSLAAATVLAFLTTVCCAWRWSLVARGLGVALPFRAAVAAYYRSQFLNTSLPGGVLGDVHRGVSHGRGAGDLARGLRAVAWERSAGQGVQLALAFVVLLLLPSPVRSSVPALAAVVLLVVLAVVLAWRALSGGAGVPRIRAVGTVVADLRDGVLTRQTWPGVVVASALVVVGHTATFLVAARTAGSDASIVVLVPLALLVLLAMAIPANVAGWGPREGVAAWSFGAAGLTASAGVATAVVYGVMVFVASLPGAVLLAVAWFRREDAGRGLSQQEPAPCIESGGAHG